LTDLQVIEFAVNLLTGTLPLFLSSLTQLKIL
jgi:hypothetical protein